VTVVADSSPLVILTKLGCFDFLNRVFPRVCISPEVHYEVVIAGTGLPGASEVSKAEWIEVKAVQNPAGLYSAQRKYALGPGEMSTILLAKELGANPVLLDDYRARKLAKAEGKEILGSVGLLETFYLRHYLTDLGSVFRQLLTHNVYIDRRLLDRRLRSLGKSDRDLASNEILFGKVVKKLIERLSALKVVQESLKGDARAAEDGDGREEVLQEEGRKWDDSCHGPVSVSLRADLGVGLPDIYSSCPRRHDFRHGERRVGRSGYPGAHRDHWWQPVAAAAAHLR